MFSITLALIFKWQNMLSVKQSERETKQSVGVLQCPYRNSQHPSLSWPIRLDNFERIFRAIVHDLINISWNLWYIISIKNVLIFFLIHRLQKRRLSELTLICIDYMSILQRATSWDVIWNFSSAPGTATLAYLNGYVSYNCKWITMIFIQSVHNKSRFLMIMLTKFSFLELKCYRCCLRIYRTTLVFVFRLLFCYLFKSLIWFLRQDLPVQARVYWRKGCHVLALDHLQSFCVDDYISSCTLQTLVVSKYGNNNWSMTH